MTTPFGDLAVLIIGRIIWSLTIAGFVGAGITLILKKKIWRIFDIIASAISLIGYFLFWDDLAPIPYYWVVGTIVAVVTLVALLTFRWPKDENLFSLKEENKI